MINTLADSGQNRLHKVTLRQGRLPRAGQPAEVVVDEAFAKAHGLFPGSRLSALVHGRRLLLNMVGTGMAPNFAHAMAPGDLLPDNRRFGVFWMGRCGLEAANDRQGSINSLAVTLERGALKRWRRALLLALVLAGLGEGAREALDPGSLVGDSSRVRPR